MIRPRPAAGHLGDGFDELGRLIAGNLGPGPGRVLSQLGRGYEVLEDSSTVVQRVVRLADPRLACGAAILRDMVQAVGRTHGDGGATAVVLARAMAAAGRRAVAAGAGPGPVGDGITAATDVAIAALHEQARPAAGEGMLRRLAEAAIRDEPLSAALGELFDVLGPAGAVSVAEVEGDRVDHHYLTGARFRARPTDRSVLRHGTAELVLTRATVAVSRTRLTTFAELRPLLDAAGGRLPLLVVAPGIGDEAAQALTLNAARGVRVYGAVLTAGETDDDLADLAALTGATVLDAAGGRRVGEAGPPDLGLAARIRLQQGFLTVEPAGTGAEEPALAERRALLAVRAAAPDLSEADDRRLWLARGRLAGRVGVLLVGGRTEPEAALRRARADKGVRLLRCAVRDGVVAGGGVALAGCAETVRRAATGVADRDLRAGYEAVAGALEAPFRQIVANARRIGSGRIDPSTALERARAAGPGWGYDVESGRYADMAADGLCDAASVAGGALRAAGATARLLVSAHHVVSLSTSGVVDA